MLEESIYEQRPMFMRSQFTQRQPAATSWIERVRAGVNLGNERIIFEVMLEDPTQLLARALGAVSRKDVDLVKLQKTIRDTNIAKTRTVNNAYHERNGQTGEWRECFSPAAKMMFAGYVPPELVALGYEQNDT